MQTVLTNKNPRVCQEQNVVPSGLAPLGNDEIIMTKPERMPKPERPMRVNGVQSACSGFGHSDFIRHSSFVIHHSYRAFSLIELIGVLAVMAILAAVLAPALLRQMDKMAGDQESAALKSFGDALQASILRSRTIPSHTNWASTVATELGVDVASVTNSPRRQARFFLIDPALQIGVNGGGLPYVQNNAGSVITNGCDVIPPVSPRVLILSSIGRGLPAGIVSGVPTAADFTNIWNAADGTVPPAPAFSGWTGTGDDLKIQRVSLSPLFVHLLLTAYQPRDGLPRYSIDANNPGTAPSVPTNATCILGHEGYYIQDSVLYLYKAQTTIDSQQILIRDNSFVYDQNVWRGSIGGGFFLGGLDIASVVDKYLAAPRNTNPNVATNQQAIVVQSMQNYMDAYGAWGTAGFPHKVGGSTPPIYQAVIDAAGAMKNAVQQQYLANAYTPPETPCQ